MAKTLPLLAALPEPTDKDITRLTPHLSNWLKCHRYLMNLPNSAHDEVGRMLCMELAQRRRLSMVDRLAARYNRMRAVALHNEVTACLNAK